MLKIIACDDDVAFLDRLHRMIDRWSSETGTAVDVALVTRGEDLLARHAASRADIILLDMIMPLVNGMDTARELRSRHRRAPGVSHLIARVCTGVLRGPRLRLPAQARDLRTPGAVTRRAFEHAPGGNRRARDQNVLGYHALRLSDIEYAEARNKHVVFHLRDGRDIEALESFRSVEDRLEQNAVFFKCHRSYQSTCAISITLTARTSSCARARASCCRAAASRDSKTPTLRCALRVGDTDGLLGRNGPLGNPPRHDAALWRLCLGGAVRCRDQPASCA